MKTERTQIHFLNDFLFAVASLDEVPTRDLTKLRRRRQRERQKSNRFNEQNNNSARASRLFVHFFAVPAQLRREMTNFKSTWERERQGDKFYHLCQNSGKVPSLQLQTKFPSFK